MVGNDIVDLRAARRESDWRRPRWLEKIFTPRERAWIARATRPDELVWLLWAAKEAAYKRWMAAGRARVFAPRRIEIQYWNTDNGTAYALTAGIGDERFDLHAELTPEYVHAWTVDDLVPPHIKAVIHLMAGEDVSGEIRRRLAEALAAARGLRPADVSFGKWNWGGPRVVYRGEDLGMNVSLAHHGRFGAYLVG